MASPAEQITTAQLAGLAKPAMVVYGGASPPIASAIARVLVELMPPAPRRSMPGAGHGMPDTDADAVADLILAKPMGELR